MWYKQSNASIKNPSNTLLYESINGLKDQGLLSDVETISGQLDVQDTNDNGGYGHVRFDPNDPESVNIAYVNINKIKNEIRCRLSSKGITFDESNPEHKQMLIDSIQEVIMHETGHNMQLAKNIIPQGNVDPEKPYVFWNGTQRQFKTDSPFGDGNVESDPTARQKRFVEGLKARINKPKQFN